ncbi:MAG: tetratricopeptide repeat protein [Candidatus Electrothrix sp. AU1_5]|nr:tetratricopeptide repeat protein [Candidatus Electrothrix gigas]
MADKIDQHVDGKDNVFSGAGDVHITHHHYPPGTPALKSPKPSLKPVFFLPQDIPRFTGRSDELDKLAELLLEPEKQKTAATAAIVGVTGQGGIGKSALAFHFAKEFRDKFPDGVIAARVNGKDADTAARIFARIAGVNIDADDTRPGRAIMQDTFAHRQVLLIFDNAETADIRGLHPGGKAAVIITTRDRYLPQQIDVPVEQCLDLPVLPDEEAKNLLACFIARNRLEAEAEAVARILELVGNLPLALEIVGKTLQKRLHHKPSFSLAAYAEALNLERLSLPRDKDLNVRICFNQSIQLLKDDNKDDLITAFSRLSACAQSGFALRTAMAAIGVKDEDDAEDMLFELVDLSLLNQAQVEVDTNRFIFHPLLHEFAEELARKSNLFDLARRLHANYLIGQLRSQEPDELVEDLEDFVRVAEWLVELEDEGYVGFYLSLKTLFERLGHWQRAARIITLFISLSEQRKDWLSLAQFHIQQAKFTLWQGDSGKAEELLLAVKETVQKIELPEEQQRAEAMRLTTLGGVYQRQGQFENAVEAFTKGYDLSVNLDDQRGQAMVLNSLGGVYQRLGKFDKAVEAFKKSYKLTVSFDDQRGQAMVLNSLGGVYQRLGKFDKAVEAFKKSAEIEDRLNNQRGQAMVLNSLGGVYQRLGKFDKAVEAFKKSTEIGEALKDQRHLAMVLNSLGGVYQRLGKFDKAVEAFKKSYDMLVLLKDERGQAMVLNSLGGVYQRLGKFDKAVEAFKKSYDISERLEEERGQAMVLNSLGGVYQRQGKFDKAVEAFKKSYELTGVIKSAVFDTLRRSFYIIPILFPVPVCTINSQGEHDPGIFRCPPCTGYFQTLLNNISMRTLYFA